MSSMDKKTGDTITASAVAKGQPETLPEKLQPNPAVRTSNDELRDLLEKNLKWSQIIYEQNRKINRKLLWSATASWLHFAVIAVPIILALLFLPPIVRNFQQKYLPVFGNNQSQSSVQELIKVLPLNDAQRAEVQAMFK